jgi:DNA integrity scanning protein DisA with diadenylate cyclase activity
MTTCEKKHNNAAPSVDFGLQFRLATDNEKVEELIFNILKNIASKAKDRSLGAIVVFGDFSQSRQCVEGLVQMKPKTNPITSLIMIDTEEGAEVIETFSRYPYDGAIIDLMVDHPTLDIPDGCGTRHKAAASFSLHNDVISVLTLSEETNTIRLWRDGKEEEVIEVS